MITKETQNSITLSSTDDWGPEWAKRVVWYQIFPERFRNGNPKNDPMLADIKGAYPHDITSPWQIHPWISDWYELQPYERENGRDIWFNIQRRRYGGDIEGILEKLDYLKDLGVGAIYLNPVFEAPSHHKYDAATYHHIDPNFGPDPVGDRRLTAAETPDDPSTWVWTSADTLMLQLIQELHRRGMKVIFDGVFNHMGLNSWAFQDVVKNQKKSKYKDWFSITSWDDPTVGSKFEYEGWFGVRELPEMRENAQGIVAGPKQYILAATQRWMDPNGDGNPDDGIDGWRLDVAFCIAHPFWVDWRKFAKSLNADAYLTAEVVEPITALKPYLQGDEFDAVMNYNFAFICAEYFIEKKDRISTGEFDRRLRELRQAFPLGVAYRMQNLFGSHDTNRLGSHIVNRNLGSFRNWGDYFGKSKAENPKYDVRKPTPEELRIQKLFAIFQMTYLGAPMIYYGDEAGMWGANDPCCRKPMIWKDLIYDDEAYLPDGSKRTNSDTVAFNQELYDHYRKLIHIRARHEALQSGDYTTLFIDDTKGIYTFSRETGGERVIVMLNNSTAAHNVTVPLNFKAELSDVLNENDHFKTHNGTLSLPVKGQWGRILVANK
ncbi:MAG: glycoside hydrolase family 13 protein [Gemmatimonadota bacterium]|nr:MAG: glycoside hydrolase family 13 protein [Gemmatimonadota bacterium]